MTGQSHIRGRFRAGAALLAALFVWCATAGLASAADDDYRLGVGDKVRIKIYEWPDISGEFTVASNGTVFMTLMGEIAASGETSVELARRVSESMKTIARLLEPPSTTVEVIEFRPFFILGEVQRPGNYPFRPGLTVIQAVSMAGGMYRAVDNLYLRHQRDAINARGDLRLLGLKIDQLTARKARLDTELAERRDIEFPDELTRRKDDPSVRVIMEEERMLFSSFRQQLSEQSDVLNKLKALYDAETGSLRAQIETVVSQLDSARKEVRDVGSLVERGLTPAPRQLTAERTLANILGEQRELETDVLRAQQNIRQTEQKLLDLKRQDRNRIISDGQTAQAALATAREELATQTNLIVEAEATATALQPRSSAVQEDVEATYAIFRRDGDKTNTIDAEAMTSVEPGDVIQVGRGVVSDSPTGVHLNKQTGLLPQPDTSVTEVE